MATTENPIEPGLPQEKRRDEHPAMPQRVYLDPSTPRPDDRSNSRRYGLAAFCRGILQSMISRRSLTSSSSSFFFDLSLICSTPWCR
jgi:hypothetical protein